MRALTVSMILLSVATLALLGYAIQSSINEGREMRAKGCAQVYAYTSCSKGCFRHYRWECP